MEEDEKIYVRFIDGLLSNVAVNAREVGDQVYEIMADDQYLDLHDCELFEFYPGDIVSVEETEWLDDLYQYQARSLISTPDEEERMYRDFLFYTMTDQLATYPESMNKYTRTVERIRKEINEGKFFYRRIIDSIKSIE
jgi:hypothetical protein